jgi:Zn-dependent peptidase ImmA (M78 family)
MPRWFKEFDYEIICKDKFSDNKHAETDIINKCIRIREDIYYQATNGYGRDRMTIVHEIAHYLLIVKIGVKLYQNFNNERIITYCDPEWQAKALAGEIMCPSYLIKNMTIDQVVKKCGVSEPAAKFALSLCNKNIL